MKYNPFKIILWILFALVVSINSIRLFIYGFVISFIIVIIDRAFFGTRKRSDTQFLNLFFVITSTFALFFTFSPFFRTLEFEVSHPRWERLEIQTIEKRSSSKVYTSQGILEKEYTPITIHYLDENGTPAKIGSEVKHYAMLMIPPLANQKALEKELDYIHNRGLNKLLHKKAIHLFKHPHKNTLKVFKGNDAFAVRHSIGSQITLICSYILFFGLALYSVVRIRALRQKVQSTNLKERTTVAIIFGLMVLAAVVTVTSVVHYLKFI
ncbi:MAG TPA: hypothetical protein VLY87_02015 [Flavobacterium sp.]|nr:hypothetical protein [Flavobacterium sp.]